MKITFLSLTFALATGGLLLAQAPSTVIPSTAVSARDGFTKSGTGVLYTRGGVSQKVENQVVLDNGLRVQADGSVNLPNGNKAALKNNQLLTLQGDFEDVALTAGGLAPMTTAGAQPQTAEVGLSSMDGFSVSGEIVTVTKNGVSERLMKDMTLENGTKVWMNGRVKMADGNEITLRSNQVLTFAGALKDAPVKGVLPSAAGSGNDTSGAAGAKGGTAR